MPAKRLFSLIATAALLACAAVAVVPFATAATDAPYNEAADAKAEIRQALAQSATDKRPLLVVFGANWCPDCKVLDLALKQGSAAPLVAHEFRVVKVDVGRFDHNVDIAESYGVPLKKGIPAVAVVSAKNEVVYVTKAGELADARRMGEDGIRDFFKGVGSAGAKPKS